MCHRHGGLPEQPVALQRDPVQQAAMPVIVVQRVMKRTGCPRWRCRRHPMTAGTGIRARPDAGTDRSSPALSSRSSRRIAPRARADIERPGRSPDACGRRWLPQARRYRRTCLPRSAGAGRRHLALPAADHAKPASVSSARRTAFHRPFPDSRTACRRRWRQFDGLQHRRHRRQF